MPYNSVSEKIVKLFDTRHWADKIKNSQQINP